jgi:hypothetical protein
MFEVNEHHIVSAGDHLVVEGDGTTLTSVGVDEALGAPCPSAHEVGHLEDRLVDTGQSGLRQGWLASDLESRVHDLFDVLGFDLKMAA